MGMMARGPNSSKAKVRSHSCSSSHSMRAGLRTLHRVKGWPRLVGRFSAVVTTRRRCSVVILRGRRPPPRRGPPVPDATSRSARRSGRHHGGRSAAIGYLPLRRAGAPSLAWPCRDSARPGSSGGRRAPTNVAGRSTRRIFVVDLPSRCDGIPAPADRHALVRRRRSLLPCCGGPARSPALRSMPMDRSPRAHSCHNAESAPCRWLGRVRSVGG